MTEYYIPGATPAFVRTGQPFALGGVQYPRKWLALASAGDLTEISAVEKPAPSANEVVEQGESGWLVRQMTGGEEEALFAAAKAEKLAELAAMRRTVEAAGIVRNGAIIATDRESQAMLSGALQLVQDDDQVIIDWKADNGWVQLDAAGVTYIAREVGLHKQAAFSREKVLATAINACETVQAVEAVDISTGWPSNTEEPE